VSLSIFELPCQNVNMNLRSNHLAIVVIYGMRAWMNNSFRGTARHIKRGCCADNTTAHLSSREVTRINHYAHGNTYNISSEVTNKHVSPTLTVDLVKVLQPRTIRDDTGACELEVCLRPRAAHFGSRRLSREKCRTIRVNQGGERIPWLAHVLIRTGHRLDCSSFSDVCVAQRGTRGQATSTS